MPRASMTTSSAKPKVPLRIGAGAVVVNRMGCASLVNFRFAPIPDIALSRKLSLGAAKKSL